MFVFFGQPGGLPLPQRDVGVPLHGEIVGILLDLLFLYARRAAAVLRRPDPLRQPVHGAGDGVPAGARRSTDDQVFAYKFQGATAFSVWAFLLLGGPILIAYGIACDAPWYFYALLPLFFIGFILLPASLSALVVLLIVNFLPRRRKQVLIACVAGRVLRWPAAGSTGSCTTPAARRGRERACTRSLSHFTFSGAVADAEPLGGAGLQAAARGDVGRSLVLPRPGLEQRPFRYLIAALAARTAVSPGLQPPGDRRLGCGDATAERGWTPADGAACRSSPSGRGCLIVKDFRTFRRDPQQWAQVLIFTRLVTFSTSRSAARFRRRPRPVLPEPRQLVLPRRRRPADLHLHGPVRVSAAEPGGPQVLGPRPAAGGARTIAVGKVRFRVGGGAADGRVFGAAERPDAGHGRGRPCCCTF